MNLKLYMVSPERDDDWCVMVAAHTAQEAKALGYGTGDDIWGRYIDVRARWMRSVTVPASVTTPTVFASCDETDGWICDAWRYDPDGCRGCSLHDIKRAEYLGDEWPYE